MSRAMDTWQHLVHEMSLQRKKVSMEVEQQVYLQESIVLIVWTRTLESVVV